MAHYDDLLLRLLLAVDAGVEIYAFSDKRIAVSVWHPDHRHKLVLGGYVFRFVNAIDRSIKLERVGA